MTLSRIRTKHLAALVLTFSIFYLRFGMFCDREFGTFYIFAKHRTSATFYFDSPVGEGDRSILSLSPREQRSEAAFNEFVEQHDGYNRKVRLFYH